MNRYTCRPTGPASLLLAVLVIATVSTVRAETFQNIQLYETLGALRARYPGAQFNRVQPAWAQPGTVIYDISGYGIGGTIVVMFSDPRLQYRQMLAAPAPEEYRETLLRLANAPDDCIVVTGVRWVPSPPVPLSRFVEKYGSPENGGIDENMDPFREWPSRGVRVYFDEITLSVLVVDFSWTAEEAASAIKRTMSSQPWAK